MSRLPLVATLCTFMCVVIMFALGIWQLQRAEQKTLRLDAIQQAKHSQAINLETLLKADLASMQDVPIQIQGQADTTKYFLVDNKIYQGRVGYDVLVPIMTTSGLLISNFGWVAATHSRAELPQIDFAELALTYSGVVSIPTDNRLIRETAKIDGVWPKVIQQADLSVIQQHYQQPVLPLILLVDPESKQGFVRNWQPVVMPPEKHIGYAVQWFLLAFAAIVIFVIAQRRKIKKEKQ